MEELTSTELAVRLHKSERTVQRWIQAGRLAATLLPDGRYAVDSDAIDAIVAPIIPLAKTDEMLHRLDNIDQRLDALEHQIDNLHTELRLILDVLQRQQQSQTVQPHEIPATAKQPTPASQETQKEVSTSHRGMSGALIWLEPDVVAWRAFARLHHVGETVVGNAIREGRLPARAGQWRRGKTPYTHGLDALGRRRFHEMYHLPLPCMLCGMEL